MLTLSEIISKLEKKFQINIKIAKSPNLEIANCMLIPSGSPLPSTFFPHCLYLLEELPQKLIEMNLNDTSNLLLLHPLSHIASFVDEKASYDTSKLHAISDCSDIVHGNDAYTFVQSELYEHLSFLNKKEELMRMVQSNFGLDALMKQAYKYLENPVYLCNLALHSISYYPPIVNQTLFTLSERGYEQLKESFCQPLSQTEFMEKIIHYPMPFFITPKDSSERLLVCAIRSRSTTISFLCVQEKNKKFRMNDIDYMDILSQILAIELQKTYNPVNLSRDHRHEEFLLHVIQGEFDSNEAMKQRLESLQIEEKAFKYIMVMKLPNMFHNNVLWVCDQLKNIFHQHMIAVYQESIVVLIQQTESTSLLPEEQTLLENFLKSNQLQAAISNQFTDLLHAKEYYKQALLLMRKLPNWYANTPIVSATECDLRLILSQIANISSLRSYIHPNIKYLNYYDEQNNTNYIETLKVYFNHNRNAMNTAKQLNIHKSTFFYRISKMNELVDLSLEDSDKLLSYEISLQIMDFLKHSKIVT